MARQAKRLARQKASPKGRKGKKLIPGDHCECSLSLAPLEFWKFLGKALSSTCQYLPAAKRCASVTADIHHRAFKFELNRSLCWICPVRSLRHQNHGEVRILQHRGVASQSNHKHLPRRKAYPESTVLKTTRWVFRLPIRGPTRTFCSKARPFQHSSRTRCLSCRINRSKPIQKKCK